MTRSTIRLSASFAALALAQCAGTAYAAEAAVSADAAEAASGAEGDNSGLTEIVVTATKRETNLQKTPISIAVMGNEDIKKRHVQSLMDLADGAVPSLRVATFEARQSAVTIGLRGIVPGDANQPAREQGVGVYIDGVYIGRQHGLNTGLLDIERIEVLKGPQGTLFGRNTEGGALSMVSRAPSGEFGGKVTAGIGNYGSYNGGLHLDLPAFANIAVKIDAAISHQDPTVKNPLDGQTGWNQFHRYGGRIAARWKPTDTFTADFAYDTNRDENTAFYSQLINYNPNGLPVATLAQIAANSNKVPSGMIAPLAPIVVVAADRVSTADVGVPQNPTIDKTHGYTATLKWRPTSGLELRSITAWRGVSDEQWDNSGGAHRTPVFLPNTTFSRYSLSFMTQNQFSQELQAVGSTGNLDYVFGLYYFNETAQDKAQTPNTNTWNATGTATTINNPAAYLNATVARASRAHAKSYAAYTNLTYNMDTLHLTLGGRYTRDEKNGLLFIVNGASTNFTFDQTSNHFDPMVTLAWDAADGINTYAKYSTGYRAGGASSRSVIYRQFGAEKVRSYELGLKTEFFDRMVRFNVAGYVMNRSDSQVDFNSFLVDPITNTVRNTLETVNAAGTTKIRGIEADLTVHPVTGLSMSLSYAYTSTKVPQAENTVQEAQNILANAANTAKVFQDVYIVFTPKNAFSASLDYDLPVGSGDTQVKFHVDANYSDPVYSFDNEPVLTDKSFIVNARLSLADIKMSDAGQKLTIAAWARNLFNESHIYRRSNANNAVLGSYANFNSPRTFGIDATVSF
jgi:iron complex outermembrane receptor protein